MQIDEMREAHLNLYRLCSDSQRDISYWRTAKLYAIKADFVCTTSDEPDSEGGADILFNNIAAKKAYWATQCYKISKDEKTTVKTIYRLDAYMSGLIESFGDSVAIRGNDPFELEPN